MLARIVPVLLGVLVAAAPALAQRNGQRERWLVLHCGALLAVPPEPALANVTVVVKSGLIDQVLPGLIEANSLDGPPHQKFRSRSCHQIL